VADNTKPITDSPILLSESERNRIVASVERKINIIKDCPTDKDYFLQIGELYKYLTGSEITGNLIDKMFLEFRETQLEFEKLRGLVMNEVNKVFNLLLGKIKELKLLSDDDTALIDEYYNGIKTKINKKEADRLNRNESALFRAVAGFYSWARGKSQTLGGELLEISLLRSVEDVVNAPYNSGQKDLVKPYVQNDVSNPDESRIVGYTIAPTENKLRDEQKISRLKLEASAWFAFQRLKLIPLCLYDYREYLEKLDNENQLAERMNLTGLIGELNDVIDARNSRSPLYFRKDYYNSYILRTADKLIDLLDSELRSPRKNDQWKSDVAYTQLVPINLPERPNKLPTDVDAGLVSQFSYKESATGGFTLDYGKNLKVQFGSTDDLGNMMNVFLCI